MAEVWRDIPGYPGYQASSLGRIRGIYGREQGKVMKQQPDRNGTMKYPRVRVRGGRRINVHQAVCAAFYGPRPSPEHEAAHWNDDQSDNRAINLGWATRQENVMDAIRNGKAGGPRPERAGAARLTWDLVREIRARYANGERQFVLAAEYGIGRPAMNQVVHNRTWVE